MAKEDYARFPYKTTYLTSNAAFPVLTITAPPDELWYVTEVEVSQDTKPPNYFPIYRKCKIETLTQKPFSFFLILPKAINNVYAYKDAKSFPVGSAIQIRNGESVRMTQIAGDAGSVDNILTFMLFFHIKKINEKGGDY